MGQARIFDRAFRHMTAFPLRAVGGLAALVGALVACATGVTVDLRDDFVAAAPTQYAANLRCEGISVQECQCRREGLGERLPTPSPRELDDAYRLYAAHIADGDEAAVAADKAISTIAAEIRADVEDICLYFREPSESGQ